jgi:hypothetical protein
LLQYYCVCNYDFDYILLVASELEIFLWLNETLKSNFQLHTRKQLIDCVWAFVRFTISRSKEASYHVCKLWWNFSTLVLFYNPVLIWIIKLDVKISKTEFIYLFFMSNNLLKEKGKASYMKSIQDRKHSTSV